MRRLKQTIHQQTEYSDFNNQATNATQDKGVHDRRKIKSNDYCATG
jgi:hypothetical protein